MVNIILGRDRAFIATDTCAMHGDFVSVVSRVLGGPIKTAKIMVLPHARCVVAYRSNTMEVLAGVLDGLQDDFECLDVGIRELPERLQACMTEVSRSAGYAALEDVPESSELWSVQLFLVGWSESEQCMALAMIHYVDCQQRVQRVFRTDSDVTHVLSCAGPAGRVAHPESVAEMAEITRALVETARAVDAPGAKGVGGTLVVTEITPQTVALHHCGDLGYPPYARLQHYSHGAAQRLQVMGVPQVKTEGLAANAATSVYATTVAGPVGVGVTTANTAGTQIASLSYGPFDVNTEVSVTATFTATVTPTATVAFQIGAWIDDGNGSISPSYVSARVPGGSGAVDHSMAINYQFAYTAGTGPFTATLRSAGGWPAGSTPAPSASIKDVSFRIEVIKR